MINNKGGGFRCKRITKAQRDEILRLCVEGDWLKANAYAEALGLSKDYAYRLARERGAIPFMREAWMRRETAE